jgi:hypothetical protein
MAELNKLAPTSPAGGGLFIIRTTARAVKKQTGAGGRSVLR